MGIEEVGRRLGIEGISIGKELRLLCDIRAHVRAQSVDQGVRQLLPLGFDALLKGYFLVAALDTEMTVVSLLDLLFDGFDHIPDEQVRLRNRQANQRICGDELGFQIGQRPDAVVVLFAAVGLLVADEGDEEAELGDLNGDGLDVHAVEAVFDEVELAAVIEFVVGKGSVDVGDLLSEAVDGGVSNSCVINLFRRFNGRLNTGNLNIPPLFIPLIELAEQIDEFMEDAHGEGTGAAGGVEDFQGVDGGDEGSDFGVGELVAFFGVSEEVVEFLPHLR